MMTCMLQVNFDFALCIRSMTQLNMLSTCIVCMGNIDYVIYR